MTKPIIDVKMSCELLYVIQVKEFLIKSFTFLISSFWLLITCYNAASDWPCTFL